MDIGQLLSNLTSNPSALSSSPALRALWLDRTATWEEAHQAIHNENDQISAAVHAYLHRKEGDVWNANYWYRSAKRKPFTGSLEAEWQSLFEEECARLGLLKGLEYKRL